MKKISAADLRDIVEEIVYPYMEMHRGSRRSTEGEGYMVAEGRMSDDEITDFVLSNPLLDPDTAWHLADPGLLGFSANYGEIEGSWLEDFKRNVEDWAVTNEWASGDLVYYHLEAVFSPPEPITEIWTPDRYSDLPSKTYLAVSPSHLMLAYRLLSQGRELSDLNWRSFEKLIGELLEESGWNVEVMRGTKDGGIDVVSTVIDPLLGSLKAIWQAKKYSHKNKVGLSSVREFSGVLERERATKGIIVTTSSFTKGALEWVQKDTYRLSAIDSQEMIKWIRRKLFKT
jgi:Restriction endonuclease